MNLERKEAMHIDRIKVFENAWSRVNVMTLTKVLKKDGIHIMTYVPHGLKADF